MKNKEKKPNFHFWKHMYPYIKEYRGKLLLTAITSILVGICVACQPLVIRYIVDVGITEKKDISLVGIFCLVYLGLSLGRIFIWRIGFTQMMKSLEGALFNLRSHFFKHVQHMCMRFYSSV